MGVFVVFDEEAEYAHNFMEYVGDKKGLPFKTRAFSEKETLLEYAKKHYIDVMLIADDALDETILEMNVGQFVVLSQGGDVAYYADYPRIYKYQSVESVLSNIIDCYMKLNTDKSIPSILKGNVADITAVYSPISRSGKTSFALTLGQLLLSDGPVLYINMEEFSGLGEIFAKEYAGDLSDLMYHYRQSPESVSVKLQAIVSSIYGMDYVPPMMYSGDIRNVKSKYWVQMIGDIAKSGLYENIIIDLSNMPEDVMEILDMSDIIYMPVRNDRMSMSKLSEYEKFLLRVDRDEILNKTVKIKVPGVDNTQWNENYFEQLIWGETGDFVRKLLKEEVAC